MEIREIKGKKIGKDGLFPETSERKGDIIYPTFYIDIKNLPEAKEWEIGKEYEITLRIRQTGLSIRKNESSKEDYGNADFEIVGIGVHGEAPKKRYSRIKK